MTGPQEQHTGSSASLTQLGVAEAEHAAVRPVDHGLDHLRHGPSAHLCLRTREESAVSGPRWQA